MVPRSADLYLCDDKDSIIGRVGRDEAHKQGLWHRCSWILLFRDASLETLLLQRRNPQKEDPHIHVAPLTMSAAGHHECRVRLKPGDPYDDIYQKVAYAEIAQELFYENDLPHGLALVQGPYIRNNEQRRRQKGKQNREHVYLYYSIYPGRFYNASAPLQDFSTDERETLSLEWKSLAATDTLAQQAGESRSRKRQITSELILALQAHQRYVKELGGTGTFRRNISSSIEMQYERHQIHARYRVL